MEIPSEAKPIVYTEDFYKKIDEVGDPMNFYSSFRNTAVAVIYKLSSEFGEIMHTESPATWITGDDDEIYPFLIKAVNTMREGELSTFYFSPKYFIGDQGVFHADRKFYHPTMLKAEIRLMKSVPISQLADDSGEETTKTVKPTRKEENQERVEIAIFHLDNGDRLMDDGMFKSARKEYHKSMLSFGDSADARGIPDDFDSPTLPYFIDLPYETVIKQITVICSYSIAQTYLCQRPIEKEKAISYLRDVCSIDPQFSNAEGLLKSLEEEDIDTSTMDSQEMRIVLLSLLHYENGRDLMEQRKAAQARKEFNKMKTAFTTQANFSLIPDNYMHPLLDYYAEMSFEDAKNQIFSLSSYEISKTYLAIEPPMEDKAIQYLKEAILHDPNNKTAKQLLESLSSDQEVKFSDPSFSNSVYWSKSQHPFEYRMEYCKWVMDEARKLYGDRNFDKAFKMFTLITNPFPNSFRKTLTQDQDMAVQELKFRAECNIIACYNERGQYSHTLHLVDSLVQRMTDSELDLEPMIVKSLYRKAVAQISTNDSDHVEETIKQLRKYGSSSIYTAKLESMFAELKKIDQKKQDFLYKQMVN